MFHALGVSSWRTAFVESGSSLLTLGFVRPRDLPTSVLAFLDAAFGLGVLALFVAYLPSIYNAFSRREVLVALLSARAGTPPSATRVPDPHLAHRRAAPPQRGVGAVSGVVRGDRGDAHVAGGVGVLPFAEERSFLGDRGRAWSWTRLRCRTRRSTSRGHRRRRCAFAPATRRCARSPTSSAFRTIRTRNRPDQTSIAREEFDDACRQLAAAGVPLKSDLDQAWIDFNGWRVNYDSVLIHLAALTVAPYAMWSSDRSLTGFRLPPITRRRRRR